MIARHLQCGLGRGARAVRDFSLVTDCLQHSYAWDWQVDARHVYLARLVRDLGLPVAPIVARLHAAPPELGDTEFTVTLGVLGCLGQAGMEEVVAGVRDYIVHGAGGREALEQVAEQWPVELWNDLLPAEGLGGLAAPRPSRPAPPSTALLAILHDPAQRPAHLSALRELARRPPEPELLEILPTLDLGRVGGMVGRALLPLGPEAVPAARRWVAAEGPLRMAAVSILAAHGDERDVPVLLAEIAALDSRPDQLCGYDELVTGLARISFPGLPAIVRRLWLTPHSYERTAYLRAHPAEDLLIEGLWDCEAGVRELAAAQVGLSAEARDRLSYLRADPMEDPDVRGAAAARLAG